MCSVQHSSLGSQLNNTNPQRKHWTISPVIAYYLKPLSASEYLSAGYNVDGYDLYVFNLDKNIYIYIHYSGYAGYELFRI
jgi:hypothetical protein